MASPWPGHDIRGVLFDWGDTLVHPPGLTTDAEGHFGAVNAFFVEDLPQRFPVPDTVEGTVWPTFRAHYEAVARDQIQGTLQTGREHSFHARLARTLALTFPTLERPQAPDLEWMADRLGARIADDCWQIEGAQSVLSQLGQRFKLGLLSNYPHAPAVHASLQRFGLGRHFAAITVSGEIGWAKPDPRAFERALEELDLPPAHVLYVGDDLVNDMQGAKALGMPTAWLPRHDQEDGHNDVDVTLTGLVDLLQLLGVVEERLRPE